MGSVGTKPFGRKLALVTLNFLDGLERDLTR